MVNLGLPSVVCELSFLYVHLSEHSDECSKIYCILGDFRYRTYRAEPHPSEGGNPHPTQGDGCTSDDYPTSSPKLEYSEDMPKPPREGRCVFYPKDPSGDPKKGGYWYYPDRDPKKGGEYYIFNPLKRRLQKRRYILP